MIRVVAVDPENRAQRRAWIHFPAKLYRGCPYWVPPIWADEHELFNHDSHPYYEHSENQFLLAYDGRRVVGRLCVMDNRRHNAYLNRKRAFFGYLELIDSAEVARALFKAAFDWARRRGLTEVYGPHELMGFAASGILIEGFDQLPAMTIPYNHAYYPELLTELGFAKEGQDSLSGYYSGDLLLSDRVEQIADWVRARNKYEVQHFQTMDDLRACASAVGHVYTKAFSKFPDFFPPTEAEIERMARNLLAVADPRLVKLARRDGEIVGFVLAYPDFVRGLQRSRGYLWPIGWLHILWDKKHTKRLDANGMGMLPGHQGVGGHALMYSEATKAVREAGYTHVEAVQAGEDNHESRSDNETLGVTWTKRHRKYLCAI